MLDGPKVSGLERWASIQQAGKGMDTASAWCLAVAVVRGDDQQGSSQPAEYWELGGQRDAWCPEAGALSIWRQCHG